MIFFENDDIQGLAMGVVVGGFGGGAFIFNQIQVCVYKQIQIPPIPNEYSYSTKYRCLFGQIQKNTYYK